jgi:hypothetical protein
MLQPYKNSTIDTGMSNILMPTSSYYKIINDITPDYDFDRGIYTFPCNNWNQLGNISVKVEGSDDNLFQIEPKHFIVDVRFSSKNKHYS